MMMMMMNDDDDHDDDDDDDDDRYDLRATEEVLLHIQHIQPCMND